MPPQRGSALGIRAPASSAVSIAALLARHRRLTRVSLGRRDPQRETKCAVALRTPVAPFARWRRLARVARQEWETTPWGGRRCAGPTAGSIGGLFPRALVIRRGLLERAHSSGAEGYRFEPHRAYQ